MKVKRELIFAVVLAFSILVVISSAFIIQGNQNMTGIISEGGRTVITGGVFKSRVVVGQPVTGIAQSANYKVCLGVMCTRAFQPEYYINIEGWLTYSNSNIASNTLVQVTISYQSYQIEETNTTDSNGYFFVRFVNLPEFLFLPPPGKLLDIKIYAKGQVEALYECTYDPSTQICS